MALQVEVNLLTGETTILRSDIIYDCGQSLYPAVDLGQVPSTHPSLVNKGNKCVLQIEGAYVQGIGFFMFEEYPTNSNGLVTANGTWSYKIPTLDTIPKQFNVEIVNSGHHQKRVLSSKGKLLKFPSKFMTCFKLRSSTTFINYCFAASGEPPLTLAVSVHCATRAAILEARRQLGSWNGIDA
ncbi:hypothetical protein V6N11_002399 [Hibiscus sabdariffa]|uniref:Aldehyde oxidase/xanthine dehydrogenase second molybdopterin binding domain-containing protein n=1 Tax=Hibiscus sabdariffa TaxID=183260 RepID=A0ABR2SA14_9ROSI